jgi:DUF4097 and DUF4098 domain-containing protein YvlB
MVFSTRGMAATGALAIVLAGPACADFEVSADVGKYVERDEKTFTTSGKADISLRTWDGAIEVRPWDKPEIHVVIEKRGRDKADVDEMDVRAEQSGDHIVVEVKRRRGDNGIRFGWHSRSAKLIVSAPASADLKASSGDGSIDVERMNGRVDLSSGDGSIKARELAGDVVAHTGDGSITLTGKLTAVRARTGDGSVRIQAEKGSAPTGDWEVTTGDGSVTLEIPEGFDAELDAHTGDGGIHMNGITVSNVSGEIRRNTVRGRLGNGGKVVRLRTGDGSITLKQF